VKTIPAASALLVAYLGATPVIAAEFVHKSAVNGRPDVITITGEILRDDEKKFYDIVYGLKDVSIVVNSKGGWNQAAGRIGVYIRHKNWETRLLKRSICNSACTLIFLAGTYRYMDTKTKLGFHSAGVAARPRERSEEDNKRIAAYLAWVEAPPQLIELQPKGDPCCINYVSYEMAKAWGVLKERPAPHPITTPSATAPVKTIWDQEQGSIPCPYRRYPTDASTAFPPTTEGVPIGGDPVPEIGSHLGKQGTQSAIWVRNEEGKRLLHPSCTTSVSERCSASPEQGTSRTAIAIAAANATGFM
jgi:hypothetical protein